MLRAMDSAVAGLRAHQNKLDVIGNNIANVNTQGFKAQNYTFKDAMYQTSTASTGSTSTTDTAGNAVTKGGVNAAQFGYGAMTGSISTDMTSGTPSYVGGFNASINGTGFFVTSKNSEFVQDEALYTRVGQLNVDSAGNIVDSNGNFVMGAMSEDLSTSPTIAENAKLTTIQWKGEGDQTTKDAEGKETTTHIKGSLSSVQIDNNGTITGMVGGVSITLGRIAIANFENPEGLTKAGNNYFSHTPTDNAGTPKYGGPGDVGYSNLMAGYIESSNVDLAKEFSDMITTERGFQANSKIITVSDEVLQELVNMKR